MRTITVDGKNVRDPAEEIREEILAGIIVGLGETFEATNLQWATGMYRAFCNIIEPASAEDQREAREHFVKLLQQGEPR